jgi:hypothetical protein
MTIVNPGAHVDWITSFLKRKAAKNNHAGWTEADGPSKEDDWIYSFVTTNYEFAMAIMAELRDIGYVVETEFEEECGHYVDIRYPTQKSEETNIPLSVDTKVVVTTSDSQESGWNCLECKRPIEISAYWVAVSCGENRLSARVHLSCLGLK